jgi:hypothetical protein
MSVRKFSLTSVDGVLIEVTKNGGENFSLSMSSPKAELSFSQLEMARCGFEDMSETEIKKKDKET